jgi:hypothetical protein
MVCALFRPWSVLILATPLSKTEPSVSGALAPTEDATHTSAHVGKNISRKEKPQRE